MPNDEVCGERWELELPHGVHAVVTRSVDDPYAQFIEFPNHPIWLPGGWGQGGNVAWRGTVPSAGWIKEMQDHYNTRGSINKELAKNVDQY